MKAPILLALGFAAAGLAAEAPVSVNRLIAIARDAIARKQADKPLAKELGKIKLAERLDSQVVEELESEGAGPAAVEQMERMVEDTEALKQPADALPFDSPHRPTLEEMRTTIQAAREYALRYGKDLPDFLCTETVRRFEDLGVRGVWKAKDTLRLDLSYADHREDYKLTAVNNRPTALSYRAMAGAFSEGEFGTMMDSVFEPDSRPRITWDYWTRLHGRPAQVFSFAISLANATYRVSFGEGGETVSAPAGSAGRVYIDPETHAVLRIARRATDLPIDFPVTLAATVLDYDYGEVGGRKFFLPAHATIRMETRFLRTRNEIEFSAYRKFQGESTISFGDPPAGVKK